MKDLKSILANPDYGLDNILYKKKKVLEVLAGYGRNVEALTEYFDRSDIELLDGSKKAMKEAEKQNVGKRYCCYLHEFKTDYSKYTLVLGVWALCYLLHGEMKKFLIDASEADRLIFVEPIKKANRMSP